MLDPYLIEKMREERERSQSRQIPLYIEPPRPFLPRHPMDEEIDSRPDDAPTGGVLILDIYGDQITSVD